MKTVIAFAVLAMYAILIIWSIYNFVVVPLLCKYSPKYAAKRKLREDAKWDRRLEKRRKKRDAEERRLEKWRAKNPDNPVAQALAVAGTASETQPAVADPRAILRSRQDAEDEYQRRRVAREEAAKREDAELLEWALANPHLPEGRRHLEEVRDVVIRQLEMAMGRAETAEMMVSLSRGEDDKVIYHQSQQAGHEATVREKRELIARIQAALQEPYLASNDGE